MSQVKFKKYGTLAINPVRKGILITDGVKINYTITVMETLALVEGLMKVVLKMLVEEREKAVKKAAPKLRVVK